MPAPIHEAAISLRHAIEHIPQGIAVFDAGLRLVFSNERYNGLLALPEEMVRPGTPLLRPRRHLQMNRPGSLR